MSDARYYVFNRGPHWLVALEGELLARHPSRAAALRSAIVMADLMGAMKHDSDVMLEADGRMAIAWTYGTDAVPPLEMAA